MAKKQVNIEDAQKEDTARINYIISSRSVKLHIFYPSLRQICTVVGRDNEYWVDDDIRYCSCKDYYFKTLSGKDECYHLKSLFRAKLENSYDSIIFDDSEYTGFINALIDDSTKLILRR